MVGNCTAREVADLATTAGIRWLVPSRGDLFPGNTETPGRLFEYLAWLHPEPPCHCMARSERCVYCPSG
jgi:L-ascorbate 6-phosphate lactonase